MDYCGYPKEEMWELRRLWSGESGRALKAARRAEEPRLKAGQTVLKPHKTELVRDGQDIVVVDIFSEAESLPVTVYGAEFLGWGNGDPQFRHIERPASRQAGASSEAARDPQTLTIFPFEGRAQLIVRSIEGSDGPVRVRVGSPELVLR